MTLRVVLLLSACLMTVACAGRGTTGSPRFPGAIPSIALKVKLAPDGPVRFVRLEDYVRAAILSEVVPGRDDGPVAERVYELQAVVARTFAVSQLGRHRREGFDLCSTTHCQLYEPERLRTSSWARTATAAAARTAGTVLWFESRTASALFHADCGGHTSTPAEVWGSAGHPYLAAIPDEGPAAAAHAPWTFEVPAARLAAALAADPRTAVGPLSGITVDERDRAGRATRLTLAGTRLARVRGEELRSVIARSFGPRAVRSTRFDVRRSGASFVFSGRGFGHGVGLCQTGARARLRAGASPAQVLSLYYPGTRLGRLR